MSQVVTWKQLEPNTFYPSYTLNMERKPLLHCGNQQVEQCKLFRNVPISEEYETYFDQYLGEGTFAKVYLGKSKRKNNKLVALKYVDKRMLRDHQEQKHALEEIVLSHYIRTHPNSEKFICQMHEAFDDGEYYVLVLDYFELGNLATYAEKFGHLQPLSLTETQQILAGICQALRLLHEEMKIVHGDIKPLNVLVDKNNQGQLKVKICDFGNATQLVEEPEHVEQAETNHLIGSMGYIAPEMLGKDAPQSAAAVDMWAVGIICFELLAGYPPFYPYKNCCVEDVSYSDRYFKRFGPECLDFMTKLLDRNPVKRMTAQEACAHPFLLDYCL